MERWYSTKRKFSAKGGANWQPEGLSPKLAKMDEFMVRTGSDVLMALTVTRFFASLQKFVRRDVCMRAQYLRASRAVGEAAARITRLHRGLDFPLSSNSSWDSAMLGYLSFRPTQMRRRTPPHRFSVKGHLIRGTSCPLIHR